MKGLYKYLLFAIIISFADGCSDKPLSENPDNVIMLSPSGAGLTKAMLDKDSFTTDGNRLQVYDIVDGNTVHIDAYAGPEVENFSSLHIPGITWPFEDKETLEPVTYQWVPGKHKFFAWLAKDNNMTSNNTPEDFFSEGFSFNLKDKLLLIGPKVIDASTETFDFVYSDIEVRDLVNDPDYSSIDLTFEHLFTAFAVGVVNNTDSDVRIDEFKIVDMYSSASAKIDYSGDALAVTYNDYQKVIGSYREFSGSYVLYGGAEARENETNIAYDIFTGPSSDKSYNMIWPQQINMVHSEQRPVESEDGLITYPDDYLMHIKYTIDGVQMVKKLNFPEMALEPGNKYYFEITFADKMVSLSVNVTPWDKVSQNINYSDAGVAVTDNHVLRWSPDTYIPHQDPSLRYAYVKNGMPVRGTFQLEAPLGGTWMASLTGDVEAFTIEPDNGLIDGSFATIEVTPTPDAFGFQRDLKVKVKFAVRRIDGRTIAADGVLQPAGTEYTIILSAN